MVTRLIVLVKKMLIVPKTVMNTARISALKAPYTTFWMG